MCKYPNVSPVLLGQGLSNSMGKSPNESTEKNVCSVTLSMQSNDKWRDDGGKREWFCIPFSLSIYPINHKILLILIPKYPSSSFTLCILCYYLHSRYHYHLPKRLLQSADWTLSTSLPLGWSSWKTISSMDLLTWKHLTLNHITSLFSPPSPSYFFFLFL